MASVAVFGVEVVIGGAGCVDLGTGIMRFGGREVATERLLGGGRMLSVDICSAIERDGETGDGSWAVLMLEALREWLVYGFSS